MGQTLTLDISSIADADGLTNASYTYLYQWIRNNAEIAGQTETTYTLVSADEGKVIKVKSVLLRRLKQRRKPGPARRRSAVAPRPNSPPTGAPIINGTPQVRRTLTVDTSEIADADGMETAVFRYQWFAATDFATLEFHGENSPTYTLGPLSEGLAIKVKVSFTDDRGHSETLTSAATEAVIAAEPNSEPTGLPTINGTPQVGRDPDGGHLGDLRRRRRVDQRDLHLPVWIGSTGRSSTPTLRSRLHPLGLKVPDQTGSTYTLAPADEGWTFEVQASPSPTTPATPESLTSAATVAGGGQAQHCAHRSCRTSAERPAGGGDADGGRVRPYRTQDGLTNVSYRYQWVAGGSDIDERHRLQPPAHRQRAGADYPGEGQLH